MKIQEKNEDGISKLAVVEATFKKMPWLQKHFSKTWISKVVFRPFTYDLTAKDCKFIPKKTIERTGLFGDGEYTAPARLGTKILLFSKEGDLIGQVGAEETKTLAQTIHKKFLWWSWTENTSERIGVKFFRETVGEALERLDSGHTVYYIVGLMDFDLIITKPSFGSSIAESLKNEKEKAEAKVEAMFH